MALGPAIPPGFGFVIGWLMDNGHMIHPDDALAALENAARGPAGRPRPLRRQRSSTQKGMVRRTARRAYAPKRTRKVSAYQREFGRQLKKLKRAHPRTPITKLMKRAHAATKRVRRGK